MLFIRSLSADRFQCCQTGNRKSGGSRIRTGLKHQKSLEIEFYPEKNQSLIFIIFIIQLKNYRQTAFFK